MPISETFLHKTHTVDLCVIGGGMSGWATAIRAARHGVKVALLHDRPVPGGNASSECRVHICGADRHNKLPHKRETGLLEELRMLNLARNPNSNFSVFDTLLYEMLLQEPNLLLLLNTTCLDAEMEGARIVSVTGWQLTTQTRHTVRAAWFSDCSGDAVLAPLTGARVRAGREGRAEYNESLAPETADDKHMGHSICYEIQRFDSPQTFVPPPWAHTYESCDDLPYGIRGLNSHGADLPGMGYWWIELGGDRDTIGDTENLRDELLQVAYGVWDHIKNRCPHAAPRASHMNLTWMQFLPAKRESRRYVGAHVLTQNDLEGGGAFEDTVAYGGWTMDDHDWAGFHALREGRRATHFNACPSPYGIPYRSLYGAGVENLFFGGRAMSATHMAMSSTRVMGTGMVMGEAVGVAVALLKRHGLSDPAALLNRIGELQEALQEDDLYLPDRAERISALTATAHLTASTGDPEPLRDGWSRQIDDNPHAWIATLGSEVAYTFDTPTQVHEIDLAFDTSMEQDPQMSLHNHRLGRFRTTLPDPLVTRYTLDILVNGNWNPFLTVSDNIHRHRRHSLEARVEGVRLRILRFHGNVDEGRVYRFVLR